MMATEQIEEIRDLLENAPLDVISAKTLYEVRSEEHTSELQSR